ncbi:EamA family transporter [Scytonema sp. UIC 10036]|uniref:EamA family transporter n=1 Tax=Scytonema sp. UIC 10036 TaxID=2304196 RepID=UPI0012DAC801|nr:EamA family transporter [Scytonema sp. UIC 10036]MUG98627.1 EamA family transporter [Scytonema sp. UIC 10036]
MMGIKSPHVPWKSRFSSQFSPHLIGLLAMLLTVVAWAIAANVANHLFLAGVQPFELAGASAIVATFGLAILDSLFGRSHARPINRQQFALGLILVGLVGADYLAIQRLPVAVAIVLLFTAPILVVLWTALTSRCLPSRPVLVALSLSIIGILLVSNLLASKELVDWFGILVGLSTAVFFAAYIVLSERVSGTQETIGVMLKVFAIASLFWIAYQLTQGVPWRLFEPKNILSVFYVGLAGNLLPYLLFFWCIQRVQAERAAIAATLEPFVAGVLAWVWFDQTLSLMQILGGFLIVAAITWMQFQTVKETNI